MVVRTAPVGHTLFGSKEALFTYLVRSRAGQMRQAGLPAAFVDRIAADVRKAMENYEG